MTRRTAFILPIAVIAVLSAVAAVPAAARFDGDRSHSGSHWDTARVLEVDPILAPGEPIYRQQCWNERVRTIDEGGHARRAGMGPDTSTVLGGIVGAAIGNQIGDGDGRRAATVAGALLGGAIARDGHRSRDFDDRHAGRYDRRGYPMQREQVHYERRCQEVADGRSEDRVVGYRVLYDYNGLQGWTETAHHPGRTIRVRVDVTPDV